MIFIRVACGLCVFLCVFFSGVARSAPPEWKSKWFDWTAKATAAMDQKRFDDAIADYSEAIRVPGVPPYETCYSRRGRGEAYKTTGQNDRAIDDYTECIRLQPDDFRAYGGRGDVYALKGDYNKAIADLTVAVRGSPDFAGAFNSRGLAWCHKGEYDKAIDDYSQTIRLEVKSAEILRLKKGFRWEVDAANEDLSRESAYSNRGEAYAHKGEYDKAIDDYGHAISLCLKSVSILRQDAADNENGYGMQSNESAARADLELARVYTRRGEALALSKQDDKAVADFSEAIGLDPSGARAFKSRGKAYSRLKEEGKAESDFAEARKLNSNYKPTLISVRLDTELKTVVLKKSPAVRLPKGDSKTVKDSEKVTHSVTIVDGWKAGAEVKGSLSAVWASLEVGIRGEIEKSTSQTVGVETERERSATLTGDGSSVKRVVWVEYYRTGTAKVNMGDEEVDVPFEFKDDFDLLTEDAN